MAYPASKSAEGYQWSDKQLKACLAANILLQILASLSGNLFATWFGPVAIGESFAKLLRGKKECFVRPPETTHCTALLLVGPIFFAAQLLANLVVFWIVLGLEAFSREMQIGTYVIVVSVILLIVNGPQPQDYGDKTFGNLIMEPYALAWACILLGAMLCTGTVLLVFDLHKQLAWFNYLVLLVSRASAFSLNLSTGKALILEINNFWFVLTIVIKVVSGAIYTKAIVVQSTAVEQKVFVPINAATIILTNALTGLIIWEDWRVVQDWIGYVCVFFLLALGCGLLLGDLKLLQETAPETFLGARASMVYKENRRDLLQRLRTFGQVDWENANADSNESTLVATTKPFSSMRISHDRMSLSTSRNHVRNTRRRATTIDVAAPTHRMPVPSQPPAGGRQQEGPAIGRQGHRKSRSDTIVPTYLLEQQPKRSFVQHSRIAGSLQSESNSAAGNQEAFRRRLAWMAVYEGAGCTSKRSSIHLHGMFHLLDDMSIDEELSLGSHSTLQAPSPPECLLDEPSTSHDDDFQESGKAAIQLERPDSLTRKQSNDSVPSGTSASALAVVPEVDTEMDDTGGRSQDKVFNDDSC